MACVRPRPSVAVVVADVGAVAVADDDDDDDADDDVRWTATKAASAPPQAAVSRTLPILRRSCHRLDLSPEHDKTVSITTMQ